MDRKKKAIIISCLFILSTLLIGIAISQSSYTPKTPLTSTYSSLPSVPPGIIPTVEKCSYTVIVNVTDYNNLPIPGANVTVYEGTTLKAWMLTNSSG